MADAAPPASQPSAALVPTQAFPWIAGLLPLLLYYITACPTLYVGDAGDFVTASYTLGMSHPPGYPLYTLLGWVFIHLPIPGGDSAPAFRMNVMSGVFGALTCFLTWCVFIRATKRPLLSLLAALAVMVSRAFWTQATIAEVYTLNTCFIMWQWWLTVRYAQSGSARHFQWLLLAMSLSLAHHYSILMFFPFMGWYVWKMRGHLWPEAWAARPAVERWGTSVAVLFLPMAAAYSYLPIVNYKNPALLGRELPFEDGNFFSELNYLIFDTILRGIYKYRAPFEDATTRSQVFEHYLKYTQDDQGALIMLALCGLWAMFLWRAGRAEESEEGSKPEPLPAALQPIVPLEHLRWLTIAFAGSLLLFFLVIIGVPSGDILNAQQTNLRVVMPPLLVPGHLFLVLTIFSGTAFLHEHVGAYVWAKRAQDPMDPAKKLGQSRLLLVLVLIGLVGVNGVRNFRFGDRSESRIAMLYGQNVARSVHPTSGDLAASADTLMLNTGDETFIYWYFDRVHWVEHPEERPEGVQFTNWFHQIPSLRVLNEKGEAEIQRDVIAYLLKQTIVERAARALEQPQAYPLNFATTFFRPEFEEVPFFRYWDVELNGLVYQWRLKEEYLPVVIQDILQTDPTLPENERLQAGADALLERYIEETLYQLSPRFAARKNRDSGRAETAGGAAARVDPTAVGPIIQQPDGTWAGRPEVHAGPEDRKILALNDETGRQLYQIEAPGRLELPVLERDWWTYYDWRGVLDIAGSGAEAQVQPAAVFFDPQEEEILSRYQDLFYQLGLQYFDEASNAQMQLFEMPESDPEFEAIKERWAIALEKADRYASYTLMFRFPDQPLQGARGWTLVADIKRQSGQYQQAIEAYKYLVQIMDPNEYPEQSATLRAMLALCYLQLDQPAVAEQWIREARILDPENAVAARVEGDLKDANAGLTETGSRADAFAIPGQRRSLPPSTRDSAASEPETATPAQPARFELRAQVTVPVEVPEGLPRDFDPSGRWILVRTLGGSDTVCTVGLGERVEIAQREWEPRTNAWWYQVHVGACQGWIAESRLSGTEAEASDGPDHAPE